MVYGKLKGLSVEQKDLPAGTGSLAPPFCGFKGINNKEK
jgi:hypothetical protein